MTVLVGPVTIKLPQVNQCVSISNAMTICSQQVANQIGPLNLPEVGWPESLRLRAKGLKQRREAALVVIAGGGTEPGASAGVAVVSQGA